MSKVQLKKFMAAFILGTFAISLPISSTEGRIHDPRIKSISSSDLRHGTKFEPAATVTTPFESSDDYSSIKNFNVPKTISTADSSIVGTPLATQEQCVNYLLKNNPNPKISVTPEEIVAYYYEEAGREGIRPDVAFAQALKETGFFRYGGDVIPEQNNFCGLGTTGGGVKGGYFATPQLGVRAHIQHLLAYSSTRKPLTPLVDPRYELVRQVYGSRILTRWSDLNGRWAVPGNYYGQEILSMFRAILNS